MNATEKLAIAVLAMKKEGVLKPPCHFLSAIRLVAEKECGPSPARDAVLEQLGKMLAQCRALCCEYDNLRALTARLEWERGVEKPLFWVGKINVSGEPAKCRQCEMLKRPVTAQGCGGGEA